MGRSDESVIRRSTDALLCFALWTLAGRLPTASAVWLNLPPTATKCVSEEIHANVISLADYAVINEGESHVIPTVGVRVSAPNGYILHDNENATVGDFSFTTGDPGTYLACFWQDGETKVTGTSVSINWKIGIAAKDWETVARKDKIEGVELELKKLEEAVEAIHQNMLDLRTRESNMRIVSEKTNHRVAWFSIMSLGVCILASALQLWYLKAFFHKKKLI